MGVANANVLAGSWSTRFECGERELEVWTDGLVTVSLKRHAILIRADELMNLELPLADVSVCVEAAGSRLDWENGELDIDPTVAAALAAYRVRAAREAALDDPLDESVDFGEWFSPSAA